MAHTTLTNQSTSDPFSPQTVSVEAVSLVIVAGKQVGERLPLDQEIMQIGRGDWCDLVLSQDAKVSKEHCELLLLPTGVKVRDLDSRNGVYINDVRVYEAELPIRGFLRLGDTVLQLQSHQARKDIPVSAFEESQQLLGQSPQMRKIFTLIKRLGPRDITVCITGETGSGKTSLARAIHQHSERRDGPFVVVNCGAISANLIESLFFGYEKGAFTGAERRHKGYFEQAHGGTLFLDELGELPLALQPKLLDVLESGRIMRLGGEDTVQVDVRVISSTHRHLAQEVQRGYFRQDLFFRLFVAELKIPSLRERPEDIPLLINWFLKQYADEGHFVLTDSAMHRCQSYLWPGNVRQLRNVIEQAIAFAELPDDGSQAHTCYIDELFLPSVTEPSTPSPAQPEDAQTATTGEFQQAPQPVGGPLMIGPEKSFSSLKALLDWIEQRALGDTLNQTQWNVSEAARRLQITTTWLYNRLKKYKMARPDEKGVGGRASQQRPGIAAQRPS